MWTDVVKFSTTCPAQDYKRLVLRGVLKVHYLYRLVAATMRHADSH